MELMTFYLQLPDSREIPIDTEITIGREAPAGVVLDDPMVSRAHAAVWQDGSAAYIRDLGSSNGTYVRGKRISGQVRLAPGSAIRLGNSRLTLLAREAKAAEGVKAGISAPPPASPAPSGPAVRRTGKPVGRAAFPVGVGRLGPGRAGIVCLIAWGWSDLARTPAGVRRTALHRRDLGEVFFRRAGHTSPADGSFSG
jgi:hypothetical protein